MSDIAITVQTIRSVELHPDADRLEIVKILGTHCVVPRGDYKPGDRVVYFPPDMMIPEVEADRLGVKKYLKHVMWNGKKVKSRIAACRIRGVTSYGFTSPCQPRYREGFDVTFLYGGEKYEPPIVLKSGTPGRGPNPFALEEGNLTRYTNIQNFWRYPDVFDNDENVVITEKIHGTNSRLGVLYENGEWVYAAGSNKVRWLEDPKTARYWNPLTTPMMSMLNDLCDENYDVIVYGEIFGPSVQDMDYGHKGDTGYRVFDIKVDGVYLDWINVFANCVGHGVSTVPALYIGPWKNVSEVIDEYVSGPTRVGNPNRKFKGREGIVIKPHFERNTDKIGGLMNIKRAILKYVSADYLDRKGAQDNA